MAQDRVCLKNKATKKCLINPPPKSIVERSNTKQNVNAAGANTQPAADLPIRQRAKRKIVSIAEKPKPEKIRVELNVEKWPGMWRPASSKNAPTVRVLGRDIQLDDGTRGTSKLEIGFTQLGTITTEDQRMFIALIEHWEESGKPADRPVFFSDRLLARLLRKKGWGSNVIEAITGSLRRLRTTPLRWINSFRRDDGSGREYAEETYFNFLDTLKIITRREHGHVTNQQGYFQFDRNILANLLSNYTKPLLTEEFFKLQTEIGQLLYTHIDLIMADKPRYERCTKELFSDFGLLENSSYRYASNRKQALRRPIAELAHKRLSTGTIKSISLERTKDGKDYKLVVVKGKTTEAPAPEDVPAGSEPVVVNHYQRELKSQVQQEAEELVRFFHQTFHGVEPPEALGRELSQATALISKLGLGRAKHVVSYAFAHAKETRFALQNFGGILNYTSRAAADFDQKEKRQAEAQHAAAAQEERLEQEERNYARGEARLAALTPEQYQARFEKAKLELYAEYPNLAKFVRGKEGSKLHESTIRARMARQLDDETMDLVPAPPATGQAT
jgi:hypothetical protein